MSQNSNQHKKEEEIEKLIKEAAKGMPIFEGPFKYNPNLGMSLEQQLKMYEDTYFVENYLRKKTGKNAS